MSIKIGCCGYPVSKTKYYNEFSLVEINSTFYNYPKQSLVSKWRKEAPENFEFTVKAHQDISHKHRLNPKPECLKALNQMVETCKILNSKILLIQTPGSFRPEKDNLKNVKDFFEKASKHKIVWVWETRGSDWLKPEIKDELEKIFEEYGVIHCTNPFLANPIRIGEIAYFRLHGLGEKLYYYQYSDEELKKLLKLLKKVDGKRKIYVLFNNLAMYTDALRFKNLVEKGKIPSLTGCYGLESFKKIVEKTKFPSSKPMLAKIHGWKLFDLKPGKQLSLNNVFEKISSKTFNSLEELLDEAKKVLDSLS
ncbi:DUF72 domain-containing protein [Candidatus Bathyarchaeota archaeon]|nr:MAG: DUF72 domain-containing protein [Candidatus Bathyarchaeota archaeon]